LNYRGSLRIPAGYAWEEMLFAQRDISAVGGKSLNVSQTTSLPMHNTQTLGNTDSAISSCVKLLRMNSYSVFGTLRDFWPNVCEDLHKKFSK